MENIQVPKFVSKEIDKGALIAQDKIKMPKFKFILNVYNKLEPVGKKTMLEIMKK